MELLNNTTSKGNQKKFWIGNDLYKVDTMGYESIAEVLVNEFLHVRGIDCVNYDFALYQGLECCKCHNFLRNGESCLSLYKLISKVEGSDGFKKYSGKDSFSYVVDSVKGYYDLDISDYLSKILLIDYITLNEDRHFNNICFILDSSNSLRESPLFDNGLSLLSDIGVYPLSASISKCIRLVKSKPFSTSFSKQLSYIDIKPLLIDIDGFSRKLDLAEEFLDYTIPFKVAEYHRAKYVLLNRLKSTEGTLWKRL